MQQAPQAGLRDARSDEIDRFARLASEWWDPRASSAPCTHRAGPAGFLRDEMLRHFARPGRMRPLEGLRVLDVGCGGGLICEPLARLGRG
jgi:2-polyprenyl-6-hydroxyphenyl methylase/3-demethylubiquinone-9 3-methyltransferase